MVFDLYPTANMFYQNQLNSLKKSDKELLKNYLELVLCRIMHMHTKCYEFNLLYVLYLNMYCYTYLGKLTFQRKPETKNKDDKRGETIYECDLPQIQNG